MRPAALLLLLPALALPLGAAKWPSIPKEVWALKDNPALVAQGAVVLEHKMDFQALYFEETLRIRILSQAGVEAAEIDDLPEQVLFLEGQVTFPDGHVQPLTKREDFQVRKVVSTVDGTLREGVLIPTGVTPDCVLEVRWREQTERGRAKLQGRALGGTSCLPERFGNFYTRSLASGYPAQAVEVQKGKDVSWALILLKARSFDMKETSSAYGTLWTFRNLPALPRVPYSLEVTRPAPKLLFYRDANVLSDFDRNAPAQAFWQKAVDFFYKDALMEKVAKRDGYKAFSLEMRKDLTGGPREKARTIAGRIQKRVANIDQLLFDEKIGTFTRHFVTADGVSSLEYAATDFKADEVGMFRLVLHVLLDEGIHPKVALVTDRNYWVINPEIRTPFQCQNELLVVEEPGQPALWLDPKNRLLPPGEIPADFQGTKAITIDSSNWQAGFLDVPIAEAQASGRTYSYRIEAGDDLGKVHLEASFTGGPAWRARRALGDKAPSNRETWFKTKLEAGSLTVAKVEVLDLLDLGKPLAFAAEATVPMEAGRILKFNPFPGMGTSLYLPPSLPQERQEAIFMPETSIQKAESTILVPKGYVLKTPLSLYHSNSWGTVALHARMDPATGELHADMKITSIGFLLGKDAYKELKDFLQWVRLAAYPEITLEKEADAKS